MRMLAWPLLVVAAASPQDNRPMALLNTLQPQVAAAVERDLTPTLGAMGWHTVVQVGAIEGGKVLARPPPPNGPVGHGNVGHTMVQIAAGGGPWAVRPHPTLPRMVTVREGEALAHPPPAGQALTRGSPGCALDPLVAARWDPPALSPSQRGHDHMRWTPGPAGKRVDGCNHSPLY
ncbi:UNVERIFIED_CONTAM: hypothetical protein K2H54_024809 [Gekko kuhli]